MALALPVSVVVALVVRGKPLEMASALWTVSVSGICERTFARRMAAVSFMLWMVLVGTQLARLSSSRWLMLSVANVVSARFFSMAKYCGAMAGFFRKRFMDAMLVAAKILVNEPVTTGPKTVSRSWATNWNRESSTPQYIE